MPSAGALKERLNFQERALDGRGDPLGDWEDRFSVRAQILYLRGSEGVMAQRLQGVQPVIITVRSSAVMRSVTSAWRALNARDREQVFEIKSAASSSARGFIDILAERMP